MQVPKLKPAQWLRLAATILPLIRTLIRVTGLGVVELIRALIDLVARVEEAFPPVVDPETGRPVKRGEQKLEAFRELVTAAFATADETLEVAQAKAGDIAAAVGESVAAASAIVGLFNSWGLFNVNAKGAK